jgi:hypothetical protein
MHASVRTYKASDTREVARRASHGFSDSPRNARVYAYYVIDGGDGTIASVRCSRIRPARMSRDAPPSG